MKFLLYFLAFLLVAITSCKKEEASNQSTAFLFDSLRDGDLVFRRGIGIVSQAVITADKGGSYSHIGIVVKEDSTWKVVHAVPGEPDYKGDPDRIKMDDIATFFHKERAKTGALMRLSADSILCYRAARHAVRLYRSNILFDHQYDLSDTLRMYCTELIDYVYKQQGIDLSEGRISRINVPGLTGNYLLPTDIQQSSLLCTIYNF